MPLNARYTAVSIAVVGFFILSFVGWFSDLSPCVCCKRAVVGAVVAYIAASLIVKAINAILVSAMIASQSNRNPEKNETSFGTAQTVNQQKENNRGPKD
jgi:hypothetical protein